MAGREGVRSSARLSGAAAGGASGSGGAAAARREARARAAAAAERRARAARAAERAREVEDSPRELRDKCRQLARALRDAKHLVVYTGAGISTAADIPDYRGPRGVWTRLQRGESVGRVDVARARPTFTHMALTALWARGALKFVVSQNCDGLHVRAGLPRRALAELHGDMYAERCAACRRVYLRAFDTTQRTARHAHGTRRLCHACGRELRDSIVHFGERGRAAWPLNWAGALRHAAAADVVLCLGSSLKVLRRYPRLWRMHAAPRQRPALYIVNLQWTPKDSVAALKINARCDTVMAQVARRLRLRVPRYRTAADPLPAHAEPLAPPERHTTTRADPPPSCASPRSTPSAYSLSSPSATDSDDELPLRLLAAPAPAAASPALTAFSISMNECDATILLRCEHAPAEPPPPEPPPAPGPVAGGPAPRASPGSTAALRQFRRHKRREQLAGARLNGVTNGHDASAHLSIGGSSRLADTTLTQSDDSSKLTVLTIVNHNKNSVKLKDPPVFDQSVDVKYESPNPSQTSDSMRKIDFTEYNHSIDSTKVKLELPDPTMVKKEEDENGYKLGSKLRQLLEFEPRIDADDKPAPNGLRAEPDDDSAARAAAFFRRAVLVCRARLYPGLHTIIGDGACAAGALGAPGAAARADAAKAPECDWCWARHAARRCLWYPALRTPLDKRAWRRERGRRYLCTCCGHDDSGAESSASGAAGAAGCAGGWYGKGYRKGRRRPKR